MLDIEIKNQLRDYFAKIGSALTFRVYTSQHTQQVELLDMLRDVAECSDKLSAELTPNESPVPKFEILKEGEFTGVGFVGVPGGHEFTSLILAVLNSAGLGQIPDSGLQARMARMKQAAHVHTFVSLSCENCPDVVQALNQIALFGNKINHTMVEGSVLQEELERLNVQGVPAVFLGDKLIHSGRGSLIEILSKLEKELGVEESTVHSEEDLGTFDVAVLGGGPAGVSAAIYSARKGLKTALIAEKIGGQVNETKGIENLISVLYTEGPQLSAGLASHVRSYPVSIFEHRRFKGLKDGEFKTIALESGETLSAAQVIVATGAKWRTLNVPGESEYLGRGVAYCPHCDGPFFKDKKVAVVGGGNSGVEAAIDLAGISKEVLLIEYADSLKADQVLVEKLNSLPNVNVMVSSRTNKILGDGSKVNAVEVENRKTGALQRIELDGLFVQIGLLPNSDCVKGVVELSKFGEIEVDAKGRTTARGIYAAGDVTTTPYKQIIIAMGEGAKVALSAFEDRMRGA
ncbi:MAG: alkyl hydroperoxide reductase subunit F [Betaproteobacteria bacterium]|nr:alkyl hydroperoxide reductase subunit F [Betaproteobacteria bacterium]